MKIVWSLRSRSGVRSLAVGALLAGGVSACEQVASPDVAPLANTAATGAIAGTVTDLHGMPVPGAVVRTAEGGATVAGADGRFQIDGLPAVSRLAVTVDAPGFDATTAIYEVRAGVVLQRPVRVQPLAPPVVIAAGAGGTVPFAGGGEVIIPANAFAGVNPGDPVTVRATYIDTGDPAQFATAPGDFTARTQTGATVQLESFGMVDVAATGPGGQRLELAAGQQAIIRFPLRGGTGATTRGLWSFDPQQGIWIEEGRATVTPTSLDATVRSVARRKNVDDPFPPVCVRVRVLRADKVTPRPIEYVRLSGISYAGSTQGWTDGQGLVALQARPASQVLVEAGPVQQSAVTPAPGTTGCPVIATLAF